MVDIYIYVAPIDEELEDWVDWMIRCTREAEEIMKMHHIPDWVEEQHRRKFRWAGHVARRYDGRWTRKVHTWSAKGKRRQGRPRTRWTDALTTFFGDHGPSCASFWMALGKDRTQLHWLKGDFVNFVLRR